MSFNKPKTFEEIVEVIDELAAMIDPKRREPISWALTNQVKALRALRMKEEVAKEVGHFARFGVTIKAEDIERILGGKE